MDIWPAHHLSAEDQVLVHEGLLIEFAPGATIAADHARDPQMRGKAVRSISSHSYTAVTRTALWIHTGYLLREQSPALTLSNPGTSAPQNVSRRRINPDYVVEIGGMRVTKPPTTCVDFLILEPEDIALEAIGILISAGLVTVTDIDAQLLRERSRNGSVKARETWEAGKWQLRLQAPLPPPLHFAETPGYPGLMEP